MGPKSYGDPIKIPDLKAYHQDAGKYPPPEGAMKYPPMGEPMKYTGPDGKPHYVQESHHPLARSPYDSNIMMKYGDPMAKYGLPPGPNMQPQDLKYPPPDPGPLKPPYHGENLIKGSPYAESPAGKYPPPESPIDASSRTTPNQDSQSSNSNSQSQFHSPHPSQNSSPIIPQVSNHVGMHPQNLVASHPGLPGSMHPVSHSPMVSTSSSPPVTASNMPVVTSSALMPPSATATSTGPAGPMVSSAHHPSGGGPPSHLTLHRPHQDIPPSIHHGSVPHPLPGHNLPTSHHVPISNQVRTPSPGPQRVSEGSNSNSAMNPREPNQQPPPPQHRSSPLAALPPSQSTLLGSIPLHLGSSAPPGIPLTHPGHPSHMIPPTLSGSGPLPLINNSLSGMGEPLPGRRTPPNVVSSAATGPPTPAGPTSAFSRASPSVQSSSLHSTSSHRSVSPAQASGSISRASPLHPVPQSPLGHHSSASALSAAAAAVAERDRHALLRQQSPHMTPPPVSSASALMASPLSKMYGPQGQRGIGSASPPHHLRPGASPPVIRHPQMPLPLPIIGPGGAMPPMGVHPAQNPYPHHLLHPSMFYAHHHNPFPSPYPYHPYGPGFTPYMKPPPPTGPMEPTVIAPVHHPSISARSAEETPSHSDKSLSMSSSQNSQHKVDFFFKNLCFVFLRL